MLRQALPPPICEPGTFSKQRGRVTCGAKIFDRWENVWGFKGDNKVIATEQIVTKISEQF
jgi:hypothetical protein